VLQQLSHHFLEGRQRCHDSNKIGREYIDPLRKVFVNMLLMLAMPVLYLEILWQIALTRSRPLASLVRFDFMRWLHRSLNKDCLFDWELKFSAFESFYHQLFLL
jgi:hypothetical protein